jgi:hypothetical protein
METENKQLATRDTVANRFLAAADQAGGHDPMLKFSKGQYYVGDDEVPAGREYTALMADVAVGWSKFVDKKVVDQKIGRIAAGFAAESREALGDTDQTQWESDSQGKPRDPWALQWYVPLIDAATDEGVVFVTGSAGGRRAVGNLLRTYGRNLHKGNPTVELGVRSYKHKEYGRIEEPELKITGWEKHPTLATEMSDAIPY